MHEMLLMSAGKSGEFEIRFSREDSTKIPSQIVGLSDTYFADNGNNTAVSHGGIASASSYTGQALSFAVDTGTVLQPYTGGTANAHGCGIYYPPTNHVIYTGGIWSGGPSSAAAYTQGCWYRPFTGAGSWSAAIDTMPTPGGRIWKGHSGVSTKDTIYLFGGFNHASGWNITDAIWKIVGSGTWYSVTQTKVMPYAAYGVGAVYDGKNIYIFGGTQGNARLKFMYRMNEDETFTRLPDLPLGVSAAQGVYLNGHIVFLANNDGVDQSCVVVAYNIEKQTYTQATTPWGARSGYAAHRLGDKAKFIGGRQGYWSRVTGQGNLGIDREYGSYAASTAHNDAIIVEIVAI